MSRFIGKLLIAASAVLAVFALTSAAWAYGPGGGTGTLSATVSQPASGVVTLTVTGSGFGPSETVQFVASSPAKSVGTVTTTSTGSLSATLTLPGGYSAGTHTLSATGSVSGTTAATSFTLAAPSGITQGCTASSTTVGTQRIVLAAFYTAPCLNEPAVALPAGPSAAPAGSGNGLAFTGTEISATVGAAAAALGGGGLLVLASRRRRSRDWS